MNIDQLQYVVEVARTKSISLASENLLVTQSAISQSISRLEEELEIKLFTRSRMGAFPTQEAAPIIEKCWYILDTVQAIKEEAKYQSEVLRGNLRLSAIPGAMPMLVNAVSSMKNSYPEVTFELSEKASGEIIKDIRNHQTDLGLIAMYEGDLRERTPEVTFQMITEGKLVLAVNAESPLASKKSVTPQELAGQHFALYHDEFVDSFMDQLATLCGQISILFRTNNTNALSAALKQQMAITVGHDYSFFFDLFSQNSGVSILEVEMPQRPIQFGWMSAEKSQVSRIAARFLDRFQYEFSKLPPVVHR